MIDVSEVLKSANISFSASKKTAALYSRIRSTQDTALLTRVHTSASDWSLALAYSFMQYIQFLSTLQVGYVI
ncbi:hypothetical protein KCU95_g21, partial [Aureobasidium melanogenum]